VSLEKLDSEVCQEVINRFRSIFGIAVQFGYSSLTHREHIPYNNLMVKELLAALEHKR
jgi:hypothetical protein